MAKTFGLALSAGAARGWAHVGVLRALKAEAITPDIITGCSVGALVGGAYLLEALPAFEAWARTLSPLSVFQNFSFRMASGGFVSADSAFEAFAEYDRDIADLETRFGAVACDLGTGEVVELVDGSVLGAARASSAIPILMNAVKRGDRWLVDGAVVDPTPIELARKLGADVVVGVDLNAVPRALARFNPPENRLPVLLDRDDSEPQNFAETVTRLINETRNTLELEFKRARARMNAQPKLFETGMAVGDIVQMQISRARAQQHPADILLAPDMREALPNAFDRADEFIEVGYGAMMNSLPRLTALLEE